MFFVKFSRFLPACITLFLLSGCVSPSNFAEFNRSEAVKARINLALAYLEQGDFPKAKENIDRAMAHDSQDYLPHSVLAYYFQLLNDIEQAEKQYQIALKLSQNQPDVRNNYGTFLCKQGRFDAAFEQFEQTLASLEHYYHQTDTLENLARCAMQANDTAKFEQALKALQAIEPERANRL